MSGFSIDNSKKCYYARPITLYNVQIQEMDRQLIRNLGFQVADPNCPEVQAIFRGKGSSAGMLACFDMVRDCEAFAFRAFYDGTIGAGVVNEIEIAHEMRIPVFELPRDVDRRALSIRDTRAILLECGRK